ncbi:hypothetical protein MSSIH_3521 [Methanosarcina siciliae HI350]|uniref:Uncharacterized protein n=1 Tax=Methanosarcina siciliae HI350 TaxID=1434119 RepID=A0A0E3LBR1_9EURY|nr:hypothetical protein [Methanosarcina siciliae]AKB34211.1 hypothetical protein MSSIH_3521 [Methanosarcina siciliae HI350]
MKKRRKKEGNREIGIKEGKIEKRFSYPADYAGCGNKKNRQWPPGRRKPNSAVFLLSFFELNFRTKNSTIYIKRNNKGIVSQEAKNN